MIKRLVALHLFEFPINPKFYQKGAPTMEPKNTQQTEKEGFLAKVKKSIKKFLNGTKEVAVKTARINSMNCYGFILFIGYLLVYEDHALVSFIGKEDVTFKKENVLSYGFAGLGDILHSKATVNYNLSFDDNVVFDEELRQKYDTKNVTIAVYADKFTDKLLGNGSMLHGNKNTLEKCNVYQFPDCIVIVFNIEKQNGNSVTRYQESAMYPLADIQSLTETGNKSFSVTFKDGKTLTFAAKNETAYEAIKSLEIK